MHTSSTHSLQPSLASIARRTLHALRTALAAACAGWMQQRRARATAYALGLLSDRTLRDIGLDRSELSSVAAEVHGQAARDRRLFR